jgi:tyrosine-protein kinase Etk/Wzc
MNPIQTTETQTVRVTVRDFLLKYLRYIPLFISSVGIALFLSFLYLRYTVPVYNSRATLLIKTAGQSTSTSEELDNMFFSTSKGNVANEIEIMKSLNLAKRVALSLGLQKRVYIKGSVKTSLSYPEKAMELDIIKLKDSANPLYLNVYVISENEFTFDNLEGKRYQFGEPFENGYGTFRIVRNRNVYLNLEFREHVFMWEPLESAAFFVLGGLNLAPVKDQSNIVQLSYMSPQPILGKIILDQLMVEYQKLNVESQQKMASQTIAFINDRLKIITQELGDVEKNLQKYKQEKGLANIESQSQLVISSKSALENEIADKEVNRIKLTYLQEYLADEQNINSVVPPTLGIGEPTLVQQVSEFNGLQSRRQAQLKTTTANNQLIKGIETQSEKLRFDILENLRNLLRIADIEIAKLRERNNAYSASIASIPLREKELLEISRQQGIKQTLYLFLFQTREETLISQAATISSSEVVDHAIISWLPVTPKPGNAHAIAIFLGLLIPVGIIYLRELLNDKIRSRSDINKVTQTPIFGEIGHAQTKDALLVRTNRRDVVTEQFRMIRTNMRYHVQNVEKPAILITSTFSGEGKSFISINTAAVMALAGHSTVVLEFDIRKPKIMTSLRLPKSQGITNYLVGDLAVESLPVPVPGIENMWVIPCGPIPPNPSEMLLNPKIHELFAYLKMRFDRVVIDTPPVGLVSDAFTLSQFADCTLYIVRMGYTLKKQMHFIEELYSKSKLPNIGLLVNDIKASSHYYSYGNYGGYGYGYGYGNSNGYFEESNKSSSKIKRFFRRALRLKRK